MASVYSYSNRISTNILRSINPFICHWIGSPLLQQIWVPHDGSKLYPGQVQYIPRNMHTVFALLCFVVVIHWLIFQYPSGLLHWHCGNLTIAPVPAKQPWWIWINTLCEFIMNDCITTTKQSTTKPCAYFLGYTVCASEALWDQLNASSTSTVRISTINNQPLTLKLHI